MCIENTALMDKKLFGEKHFFVVKNDNFDFASSWADLNLS